MKNALEMVFPKETKFFELLHEQAANDQLMQQKFTAFLAGYDRMRQPEKEHMVKKIKELEGLGDKILALIFAELESSFITPIGREDIHRLAMRMDDVADGLYHMAKRMVIFRVTRVPPLFVKINKTIGQQLDSLVEIMRCLNDKKKRSEVKLLCIRVQSLENEAEDQIDDCLAHIFSHEMPARDLIKLKDLCDIMRMISANVEDVTYLLENIEVKNG